MSKISGKFKIALMDLMVQHKIHEYTSTPTDILVGCVCMHIDNMGMFTQMRDAWFEAVEADSKKIIVPDEPKLVIP